MKKIIYYLFNPHKIFIAIKIKYYKIKAIKILKSNRELWNDLNVYIKETSSTGCSFIDYAYLYNDVLQNKPKEILECGTGISTIVIAHAIKKNGNNGKLTSMESIKEWYEIAIKLLPKSIEDFVDIKLSTTVEDAYTFFRGVRYKNIPHKDYELIYIDGPSTKCQDGTHSFDFDFIHVLNNNNCPIRAIIDTRLGTVWVLQKILGSEIVKYDAYRNIGYTLPCTKNDIKYFDFLEPSKSFKNSISYFRDTNLKLNFNDYFVNYKNRKK